MEKKQVVLLALELIVLFSLIYITVNIHNLPSLQGFAIFEDQSNSLPARTMAIPNEFKLKITDLKLQNFEKVIYLANNIEKKAYVEVNNTGTEDLTDVYIELGGINSKELAISPLYYKTLKAGDIGKFEITFFVSELNGEKAFNYTAISGNISKKESAKIAVFTMSDLFLKDIEKLKERILIIRDKTYNSNVLNNTNKCEKIVAQIEKYSEGNDFINVRDELKNADDCLEKIETSLNVAELPIGRAPMSKQTWAITGALIIILIIAIIVLIYFIYQKFSLINFLNTETKNLPSEKLSPKEEDKAFEERLKRISDKLKD